MYLVEHAKLLRKIFNFIFFVTMYRYYAVNMKFLRKALVFKMVVNFYNFGSIVFRNEEDLLNTAESSVEFYNNVIAPYTGKLEQCFAENQTFRTYLILIFFTIFSILNGRSGGLWKIFPNLPGPLSLLIDRLRLD